MIKYNVVVVFADYKVDIIKTFLSHRDANEFLSCLIDKNFKGEKESSFKVYHDSKDLLTVFNLGYLSKSLFGKYYIIKHDDHNEEKQVEGEEEE